LKAIVCTGYGPPDVLQLRDVEKPTPKENEILVRVAAATVTAGDCEIRRFKFPAWIWLPARIGFGFRGPRKKVLGQELAGEIESVGKNVKRLGKGDQIVAWTGFGLGAYAEYACLSEKRLVGPKPANTTYEEAATIPVGGLSALHLLRKASIQPGQKVLINGAGGSIGTWAVQIAKNLGADVACVDSSEKLDMLSSLGADTVIDYTREDFTKSGKKYDVILDTVGKSPFSGSMKSLRDNGYYILGNAMLSHMLRKPFASLRSSKKIVTWDAVGMFEDLNIIRGLIESGKIRSVIDRRYPLEQVAEAHRYVDSGNKKGNVVINVGISR
jgi:NADPH:quinone reductase-like Zn-dependent oxidoreductase